MALEQFNIVSLFQPNGATATTTKRKDSSVSDAITQLNSFKGFGIEQAAKYTSLI
jgi:hypothetical protein